MKLRPSPIKTRETDEGITEWIEIPAPRGIGEKLSVRHKPEYEELSDAELDAREQTLDRMSEWVRYRNKPRDWLLPFVIIVWIAMLLSVGYGESFPVEIVIGVFGLWIVLSASSLYRGWRQNIEFKAVYNERVRTVREKLRREGEEEPEFPREL